MGETNLDYLLWNMSVPHLAKTQPDFSQFNQTLTSQLDTAKHDDDYESLFKFTQKITGLYLMPIVSILGILGNILIVMVYSKSKLSSTNIYLITLSLSDILKLANDFLYFIVTLINIFNASMGDQLFKSLYLYSHFVFLFTAINTSWLTCAIALDRYISIVINKKLNQQPGYFKTILANLIIFILSAISSVPSPVFLMYGKDSENVAKSLDNISSNSTMHFIFTNSNYKKSVQYF